MAEKEQEQYPRGPHATVYPGHSLLPQQGSDAKAGPALPSTEVVRPGCIMQACRLPGRGLQRPPTTGEDGRPVAPHLRLSTQCCSAAWTGEERAGRGATSATAARERPASLTVLLPRELMARYFHVQKQPSAWPTGGPEPSGPELAQAQSRGMQAQGRRPLRCPQHAGHVLLPRQHTWPRRAFGHSFRRRMAVGTPGHSDSRNPWAHGRRNPWAPGSGNSWVPRQQEPLGVWQREPLGASTAGTPGRMAAGTPGHLAAGTPGALAAGTPGTLALTKHELV
ncbi:hypothetical protein TREES_T100008346 [Tupaia chinensis]|uniref:Uncharacterized protein n=1 Tax=Tupaia chinensis TaxID=246437 RepID=L9LEK8_TUPCH|nr:hypothetical protein TREES_T100008346 [Tupaia chinensis]